MVKFWIWAARGDRLRATGRAEHEMAGTRAELERRGSYRPDRRWAWGRLRPRRPRVQPVRERRRAVAERPRRDEPREHRHPDRVHPDRDGVRAESAVDP